MSLLAPRPLPAPLDFTRESAIGPRLRHLFHIEAYGEFHALIAEAGARLAEIAEPSQAYLLFLLRFGERACLPPSAIEQVLSQLRPRAMADDALRPVWQAVARRQVFRGRLHGLRRGPLTLVSLGLHCLPWTLVNRWGFREAGQFATLHNPFCLAVHKAETVAATIATDFAHYADPAEMREAVTPQGQRIAMRRDGGAVWNHNRGEPWMAQDYAGLRAAIAAKAEAFRQSCRAEGLVFLMGDCRIDDPAAPIPFLDPLRAALAAATGQNRPRLILTSQSRRGGRDAVSWLDRETALISAPYPRPRYIWADDDQADSAEGLTYEHGYAVSLLRCLMRWGLAARPGEAS
ncbi:MULTISPECIES: hypothetical protein [Roseomonadaceae]|uniref:Uncharacterized protein n=1 Tax=Falsiroseomonas oleicola TaxID=2801474 RepID=A0ABS6HBV2_9PROT|nr:hypothetical protein [Roseomonas oleicola]MBU8545413.1 hypothetical protein [Roseomonas oleicola]